MQSRTFLANYQIQRILGQGGMGVVYLARHTQIGKLVAIKELAPQYSRDVALRLRFKNEAALMANLNHPNLVTLHDYMETPQGVYLIMEYVEGITLEHYIKSVVGAIPEEKAVSIFKQILEGVGYAHSRGIVHRDLKPANVMFTAEGNVKILDFGIAKNLFSSERAYTQAGLKVGTIYYMSPEQVLARDLDRRSDVYSLGVLFFEMLTGKNPYEHLESEYEISHKIIHEPLPDLRELYPHIHPYWQKVITKATQKNVGARYQQVSQLAEALQAELEPFLPAPRKNRQDAVQVSQDNLQHTVEWNIRKANAEGKTEISFAQNSAIAEALREPEPQSKEEPEVALFENEFGKLTNKRLTYPKGRDYFEAGKEETLMLAQISNVQFQLNQEAASGVFFSILASGLLLGGLWNVWAMLFALPFLPIAGICFTQFPAIVIAKKDGKKTVMRGWYWHTEKARELAELVRKELNLAK